MFSPQEFGFEFPVAVYPGFSQADSDFSRSKDARGESNDWVSEHSVGNLAIQWLKGYFCGILTLARPDGHLFCAAWPKQLWLPSKLDIGPHP